MTVPLGGAGGGGRADGIEGVQREGVAHITQVDEFIDLAVGIAGNIHQRAFAGWTFQQPMDGHDGKELSQRPMIEQGLLSQGCASREEWV